VSHLQVSSYITTLIEGAGIFYITTLICNLANVGANVGAMLGPMWGQLQKGQVFFRGVRMFHKSNPSGIIISGLKL